ncbi:MAG: glycosyl transferase family 2 [Nitrospira sp.]|nr:glycosyl transferase family 2 [Nitrospira sp.]
MDQPTPNEHAVTESFLPEPVRALLDGAEPADIVIGLLTFNDASTAPAVARTLLAGLNRNDQQRILLVNCDAGSQDRTPDLVQQAVGDKSRFWAVQHPVMGTSLHVLSESGVPGRDTAVRTLAMVADRLASKACLIVDGNLKSTHPRWAELLTAPILEKGADCVLPQFNRNRYEGTLTSTLLAPVTRALYGRRVAYHQGGAYAFSGAFIRSSLLSQPWDGEVPTYGIDGWVMTLAVAEQADVYQARLGPRVQQAKPLGDLATIIAQAVGCVFHMMERYQHVWESVKASTAVSTIGEQARLGDFVGTLHVERMIHGFRQGLRDLVPIWQIVLSPETFQQVLELGVDDTESFRFPSRLWVQAVYDLALAYHDRLLYREHLLKSLTPLYLGYTASLVLATRAQPVTQVEEELERLAIEYEAMKPYLTQRWRWSDE